MEHFIYNAKCDLYKLKYVLENIYSFLQGYEELIDPSDEVKKVIIDILKSASKSVEILTIIKSCINHLNIRILYETLHQHQDECGKIIIMKDCLVDCTLKGYLKRYYGGKQFGLE